MSDLGTFFDIRSLAKLLDENNLKAKDEDNDSDSEIGVKTSVRCKGPGDIHAVPKPVDIGAQKKISNSEESKGTSSIKCEKNDIWKKEDLDIESDLTNSSLMCDPRKIPQYDIHYRQSITTEDVFLQMGNKTPGTASCEELVVDIILAAEDYHKVKLNLKKQLLDLRSPIYFLHLGLPHPIDPKAGNAKWDQTKEQLTVTLKLARELDDLNF